MVSVVLLLATFTAALQQPPPASAVFIVRHGERADATAGGGTMMKDDPELSARGHARAKSLAGMLRDAGIRAIYASEWKRTQQTAAPMAVSVGAKMNIVAADDVAALVEKVKGEPGNVLIVGHSNTIPKILAGMGVENPIEISDTEFDNLLIVIRGTPPRLVRLRYE